MKKNFLDGIFQGVANWYRGLRPLGKTILRMIALFLMIIGIASALDYVFDSSVGNAWGWIVGLAIAFFWGLFLYRHLGLEGKIEEIKDKLKEKLKDK